MTSAVSSSARESELRQRASKSKATGGSPEPKTHSTRTLDGSGGRGSIALDLLRALVGLVLISSIGSYVVSSGASYTWHLTDPGRRPWFLDPRQVQGWFRGPLQLTNDQLAHYDGSEPGVPIYLALNRTIYDVSQSPHVYGPGGMYSSLAAKDASRSYITTCFDPVEDLVPCFGGVEEVYVPLWLSRRPSKELKPELDAMGKGELVEGKDAEDILDTIRKRVGRKLYKQLQREAYEEAKESVRKQVQQWEGMFANKAYPIVGRVVEVDEADDKKWRHLGFCEASLKLRPSMGESIAKAMERVGKGTMNIKMDGAAKARAAEDSKAKSKKKGKGKGTGKKKDDAADAAAPAGGDADGTDHGFMGSVDHESNPKANVRIEDMLKGGKYYGGDNKKARKIEEIMRNGPKGEDEERVRWAMEQMKKAKAEMGDTDDPVVPDAVPEQVMDDDINVGEL